MFASATAAAAAADGGIGISCILGTSGIPSFNMSFFIFLAYSLSSSAFSFKNLPIFPNQTLLASLWSAMTEVESHKSEPKCALDSGKSENASVDESGEGVGFEVGTGG